MDLKERFLKYVSYDTQSSEESTTFPSTEKQKVLLAALRDEMEALGMTEVTMDQYGYVMGTVPASKGCENAPVIGFIAHVDTSPDMSGKEVKPRVIDEYDGSDIALNGQLTMRVADFPELAFFKGHTLIHTDGTTLLGADDKAGVAEIMALVARIAQDPSLPHPALGICFCPDEEIGHGAELLDIEAFGCKYAYTVDGGPVGELEWECFNAAEATVRFEGQSIHPGDAKGRMVNAGNLFCDFNALLPYEQRPEYTEGYEGFYHLEGVSATVDHATARYIVRDHDAAKFQQKLELMNAAAALLNQLHPYLMILTTLAILPGTELYDEWHAGIFQEVTERERLDEFRTLLANMNNEIVVFSATSTNSMPFVVHMPFEKAEIVQKLDAAIDSMTDEKEARIVESRHRMTSV